MHESFDVREVASFYPYSDKAGIDFCQPDALRPLFLLLRWGEDNLIKGSGNGIMKGPSPPYIKLYNKGGRGR